MPGSHTVLSVDQVYHCRLQSVNSVLWLNTVTSPLYGFHQLVFSDHKSKITISLDGFAFKIRTIRSQTDERLEKLLQYDLFLLLLNGNWRRKLTKETSQMHRDDAATENCTLQCNVNETEKSSTVSENRNDLGNKIAITYVNLVYWLHVAYLFFFSVCDW